METRNTKQKETILKVLSKKENMFHPTAQDIVRIVREEDKTISQATIYRNINKLVEEGTLLKLSTNENYKYDINTNIHAHLVCKNCDNVTDLYDQDYQNMIENIESKYKIKIDESNIIFNGYCEECNGKI